MSNKKVYTLLNGGLGNQLHQYAFGLFFSSKVNGNLSLDVSYYSLDAKKLRITPRVYMLHQFGIMNHEKTFLSNQYLLSLVKNFKILDYIIKRGFKIQFLFKADSLIDFSCRKYVLVYLFGNLNNHESIIDLLINKIKFPDSALKKAVGIIMSQKKQLGEEFVIVHIRRSDYLLPESIHHVLDKSYYYNAIDIIRQKVTNPIFYFIGDDLNWIKQNFDFSLNTRFVLIDQKLDDPISDFILIANSDHVISSNSTFCWWGSFLNKNSNKIVLAPTKWLKSESKNIKDQYPDSWLLVD
jgi:hypothetical protein